jgi:hypothetical protein
VLRRSSLDQRFLDQFGVLQQRLADQIDDRLALLGRKSGLCA